MPQLPDLEAWAIFATVAERGSFSQAAEELGLAKTTVSKTVSRLEARFQTSLLHRTTRKLSLTESGRLSLQRASRILLDGKSIEAEILSEAAVPKGLVRIVSTTAFGTEVLAPALPDFLERYPDVEIDLCLTDRAVDIVAEGFDLSLQIGRGADSSLRVSHLFSFRRRVLAAPPLLERFGVPEHPSELAAFPGIVSTHLPWGHEWAFTRGSGESCSVSVRRVFSANNAHAIVPALIAGIGIAAIPEYFVRHEVQEGRLEVLVPEWSATPGPIDLLTPPGRARPARVRVLIEFLRERFASRRWTYSLDG